MKKLISLAMAILLTLALVSCDSGEQTSSTNSTEDTDPTVPTQTGTTATAVIDDDVLYSAYGCADKDGKYVVPDGIKLIAESAFAHDYTLRSVVLPASVTEIGSNAFADCTSLESVEMSENVKSIGTSAFYGCISLGRISIPQNLTELLPLTFAYCDSLDGVTLHEGLRSIGESTFEGCASLGSITIPSSVEMIDSNAFSGCVSLSSVRGLESSKITSIPDMLFLGCTSLVSLTLPEGIQFIGSGSFMYCSNLSEIVIPDSVSDIGMMAFSSTPWYSENTEKYMIVGNGVLIKSTFNPNAADVAGTLDLSGLGVKSIGNSCFANLSAAGFGSSSGYRYFNNIKHVVIGEGTLKIGDGSFYGCTSIETIDLPSTLVAVGADAFFGMTSTAQSQAAVSFDKCTSLETIGNQAFFACNGINEISLPESVKYIGSDAFTQTPAHFAFANESLRENSGNKFKIVGDGVLLWVYAAKGSTQIAIPDGVKYIAGGACKGWDSAVVYSDFETEAENELIKTRHRISYNIEKITIPDSVIEIGNSAFERDMKLSSITIPDSVIKIGGSAFYQCSALASVTIGKNVTSIGGSAFASTPIVSIGLPSGLVSLGASAFTGCGSLESLVIPKGTSSVGTSVVDGSCTSLKSVYMARTLRPFVYYIIDVETYGISDSLEVSYFVQ